MDFGKIVSTIVGSANPANAPANLVDAAHGIISLFKLDPNKAAELQAQLTAENMDMQKAELASALAQAQAQAEINKVEAASPDRFISGWRPAVGWVCVTALAYGIVLQPFLVFVFAALHLAIPKEQIPTLDLATVIELLVPLLGIGALRTYEKVNNAEGNR